MNLALLIVMLLRSAQLLLLGVGTGPTGINPVAVCTGTPGSGGGATSACNMSGATTLMICAASDGGIASFTFADSSLNSYTSIPPNTVYAISQCAYADSPTVSSSMTGSALAVNSYPVVTFWGFSGTANPSYDSVHSACSNNFDAVTSFHPGPVTTVQNGSLLIAPIAFTNNGSTGFSISGGFTLDATFLYNPGVNYAGASAHLIQATAGSTDPVYSWSGANDGNGCLLTFKHP